MKAREARERLMADFGLQPSQVQLERLSRKMVALSIVKDGQRTEVFRKEGVAALSAEEIVAAVKTHI